MAERRRGGAGLELRGERFYIRALAERLERSTAESARAQLGVGVHAHWRRNVHLIGEAGARYLDSNWTAEWGDERTDVAMEFGLRSATDEFQMDIRAVVLTPTDSGEGSVQAGYDRSGECSKPQAVKLRHTPFRPKS